MDIEPTESIFNPNYKKIVDQLFRRATKMVSPPMDLYRTLYHVRSDLFSLEQELLQTSETEKLNFRIKVRLMPSEPAPAASAAASAASATAPVVSSAVQPAQSVTQSIVQPAQPAQSVTPPPTQDVLHILIISGYWNKGFHSTLIERETSTTGTEQKRITIATF